MSRKCPVTNKPVGYQGFGRPSKYSSDEAKEFARIFNRLKVLTPVVASEMSSEALMSFRCDLVGLSTAAEEAYEEAG